MNVRYPYQLDSRRRTADASEEDYIRGLIQQLLLTSPGERVMRPDFGSGLMQLVFAPNSPELAATTQFLVQGALQQWLGHLITVESAEIEAHESELQVTVRYTIRRTQTAQVASFTAGGAI